MKRRREELKVLLFDLDGTLVIAGGAGRRALNRAIFEEFGAGKDCGELRLAGKTDLRNFSEAIRQATGKRATPKQIDRVHARYLRALPRQVRVARRAGAYRLTSGVRRLLSRLSREDDVLLGLGTGNVEQGAFIKLAPSGLAGHFRFGGYGSDAYRRSHLLRVAVARARKLALGRRILRANVYVIGDTPLDVKAGRAAGYRTVGVSTGFSSHAELARARPDHLAWNFHGIKQWLKWLGLARGGR